MHPSSSPMGSFILSRCHSHRGYDDTLLVYSSNSCLSVCLHEHPQQSSSAGNSFKATSESTYFSSISHLIFSGGLWSFYKNFAFRPDTTNQQSINFNYIQSFQMQFIKVIPWKGVKVEENNNISSATNNVSRGPRQKTRSVGLLVGKNCIQGVGDDSIGWRWRWQWIYT